MKPHHTHTLRAAALLVLLASAWAPSLRALQPADTLTLSGSAVEYGAPAATQVGLLGVSGGSTVGVTFSLVSGTGDADNASFSITGVSLTTAPGLLVLPGSTASVRVRATEGAVQVEQVFALTILQGPINTLVLPVPPPDEVPGIGSHLGRSVATDGVRTVAGAPTDDTRGADRGVAKVFSNTTGELLHVLKNPDPYLPLQQFGHAVAIDGDWVVVGLNSSDRVYVFDLSSTTPEEPALALTIPSPESGEQSFGRSVAISGSKVVVGAHLNDVGAVSNIGSVFVYDLGGSTPTVPAFTLSNPAPDANDQFGSAVAIAGSLVVVGAPLDDIGAPSNGVVYKYDLGGASPLLPVAVMNNPSPNSGDAFGTEVAVALDGRVAVGCASDDTSGTERGRAYLFHADGTLAGTVENPDAANLKEFGTSIALSTTKLAVGMFPILPGGNGFYKGRVAIYSVSNPTAPPGQLIAGPEPAPYHTFFGHAVALAGESLVVGAYGVGDDIYATDNGSAYLYDLGSATPSSVVQTFHHRSPSSGDHFGGSYPSLHGGGIALAGTRMVVSATGGANPSKAWVYDFTSTQPDVPVLGLSSPLNGQMLGYGPENYASTVAMDGSRVVVASNDGYQQILNVFGQTVTWRFGKLYVHDMNSATPETPSQVIETSPGFQASRVAIAGTKLAVSDRGAVNFAQWQIDGTYPLRPQVKLYDLGGATPTQPVATLFSPDSFPDPSFGDSIALSGTTLVVADSLAGPSAGQVDGRVYVYDWSGPTPVLVHTLLNPEPGSGIESFGESVAVSGTRVIVAAHQDFTAPHLSGVVYVYDLASATPTVPVLTLTSPQPILNASFGWSVAIDGTRAMVSEMRNFNAPDFSPQNVSRAYIYDLAGATPATPVATLVNPQPSTILSASDDNYGQSVALSGSLAAVGAPQSNIVTATKGYAWVFGPAPANTAPMLTLNGADPLSYEARTSYTDPGATATDAEDGAITPVISSSTVVANVPGTYAVTWLATDSIGAVATKTRTVNVIPSVPPTLSAPMGGFVPLTLREGDALPNYVAQAVATDNSGIVTVTQSIAPGTVLAPGTYTVTLTATDGAGNQTTLSFTVTVNAIPATGIFSGDFPLNPKNMWWHNEFTAHPTNGWLYGACARGGQFDNGMIFRVNSVGDYETLVHFNYNGARNKGMGPSGRLTMGADGLFYGTTGEGGENGKGTIFKMTPEGELTTLAQFTGTSGAVLGAEPTGGVIEGNDGNFYGTTQDGGTANFGTVFKITPAGVFTSLVSFTDLTGPALGSFPNGTLAKDADGNFYGTTVWGGTGAKGTIFKITPAGVLTNLVNFTGTSGAAPGQNPNGSLTLGTDGNFYGMTDSGGTSNLGTVFKMTPAGVLTTLVHFTGNGASNKGARPFADLTRDNDGNFYGMTSEGGASGKGTIFKMTPGGVLTTLVQFTGNGATDKGAYPKGTLGLGLDGNLYGMTQNGGAQDQGTVFKMTPTGALTTLLESTNFYRGGTARGYYINGGLCQGPDGAFYGMANSGGNTGNGTIFKIDAFGQRTTLVHFTGTSGENRGGNPVAGLVLAGDGNFYGTTLWGGTDNLGTIFRMTPEGVYTVLVDFTGSNGAKPWSRLTVGPDGSLYAVTGEGGSSGLGVFFRLTTAGVYTKLADFTGVGGAYPGSYSSSPLTLGPDGNFYATQFSGGNNDYGTIYQMTPSGVMTILKHLDASSGGWPCGAPAFGPDGSIYGMTNDGGTSDFGTIYKITNPTTPASSVFSKLIDFSGTSGANRGAWPLGTMFYAPDGYFYGATNSGGTADMGTLFKMTTGGIMTVLTDFKGAGSGVDSGGWPYNDEFTLASDGRLYGITNVGGRQGGGLVYRIEISVPEIAVSGNGENIANNDATPSATDHTQLGQAPVASGSITRSFTITNAGSADLTLGTVSITGANAGDFTVSTAPATTVSAGNSTTLSISFDPSATGSRVAQVTFSNNDPDENPFTFSISGTGNTPPVFAGMTLDTVQGKVTVIDEAKILVRASDVDGTTVSITGFSTTSAQGATIARSGGFITWTPSPVFTGTDTFTVTLSDGTSTVQGTITLNVAADPGLNPANPPQLNFQPGGALRIAFFGIPGRTYGIQRSTDLANWTQIAAPSAGAQGSITFDDPSPPSGGAFYRIIFPAE